MTLSEGVYFKRDDYAGFWRRLLIDVIDLSIVACACVAATIALDALFPSYTRTELNLILLTWCTLIFGYFVLLKRSRIGTLGYRLGRVRIVGLDGQPASLGALTFRTAFMFLGPLNGVDFLWLASDPHRQTLRDKLAHTYVILRNAEPAGAGKIAHRSYEICGYNFLFREVVPDSQNPPRIV